MKLSRWLGHFKILVRMLMFNRKFAQKTFNLYTENVESIKNAFNR